LAEILRKKNIAGFYWTFARWALGVVVPDEAIWKKMFWSTERLMYFADEIQSGLGPHRKLRSWKYSCGYLILQEKHFPEGTYLFPLFLRIVKDHVDDQTRSTWFYYGGNPIACKVSVAALTVLKGWKSYREFWTTWREKFFLPRLNKGKNENQSCLNQMSFSGKVVRSNERELKEHEEKGRKFVWGVKMRPAS